MGAVDDLFGSDKVKEITGETQPAKAAPPPAPRSAPVRQVAPAAPAPEVEEAGEEAPAPAAAAPKRGFGAAKPAAATPAPRAAAPKPAAKPAPAVSSGVDLADEIANMIGDMGTDDA